MPPAAKKCLARSPVVSRAKYPMTRAHRARNPVGTIDGMKELRRAEGNKEIRREQKMLARRRTAQAGLAPSSLVSSTSSFSSNDSSPFITAASHQATASMNSAPSESDVANSIISVSMADASSINEGAVSEEEVYEFRARLVGAIFPELEKASLYSIWSRSLDPQGRLGPCRNPKAAKSQPLHGHTLLQAQLQYLNRQQLGAVEQAKLAVSGAQLLRLYFAQHTECDVTSRKLLDRLATELRRDIGHFADHADSLDRVAAYSQSNVKEIQRYHEIAQQFGWMTLAILSHSATIRTHASNATERTWDLVMNILHELRGSIEMFAKARGLDWKTILDAGVPGEPALASQEIGSRYNTTISHPHEFYLDREGIAQRATVNGEDQTNTTDNVYNEERYGSGKPRGWPRLVPFPTDPTAIHLSSMQTCHKCHKPHCQDCTDLFTNPLLEIFESSDDRGRGVRALEFIPAGDVLGEYVGQIEPKSGNADMVYSMMIKPSTVELGLISAAKLGNWTRFINHACESNTHFATSWSGGRYRTLVISDRDIQPFEEVTVDYGAGYWDDGRLCLCGSERCKYNSKYRINKTKRAEKAFGRNPTPRKRRKVARR